MKKDLRIVFMGTPDFAVASLEILHKNGYNIVGVVTTADKKAGRGKKVQMAAVKKYALENDLHLLTPLKLKDPEFLKELNSLEPNLQVVVAFRMLPELVWQIPEYGTFNLHGSLLPQYRGAAPINHAIIKGEKSTGVTTFFLDKEIDTGRVIAQRKCDIGDSETAGELHDRLMTLGADLVLETVESIASNSNKTVSQDDLVNNSQLNAAPKIFKEDGQISWSQNAQVIFNKVRGLSPYPAAWSIFLDPIKDAQFTMKIYACFVTNEISNGEIGSIQTDGKTFLRVHSNDYCLDIVELQLQGKKRMKIADFLRGFAISDKKKFIIA